MQQQHNYYTRRQLSILGIGDLQEIAREVRAELPPEGSMRRFWIDAILAVAERKATDSSREVKLDNYPSYGRESCPSVSNLWGWWA